MSGWKIWEHRHKIDRLLRARPVDRLDIFDTSYSEWETNLFHLMNGWFGQTSRQNGG
jgi:hypothetical protein